MLHNISNIMSSDASPQWIWSETHQDYYYVTYEQEKPVYHWYKQIQHAVTDTSPEESDNQLVNNSVPQRRNRIDSGTYLRSSLSSYSNPIFPYTTGPSVATSYHGYVDPSMPEQVPPEVRVRLPNFFPGTPDRGWLERLDSSYRMRTGTEARDFFKKGRVFSMLYSEAASETLARNGADNDAITVAKFGERVYSQIRRFVIVKSSAISTYSHRGTTKSGCNPSEHVIVYFTGESPVPLQGEYGITKEPIEIEPANPSLQMESASRLRLGKTYSIEWNVKVKDIGRVIPEHMSRLVRYWKDEDRLDDSE
ncbi:hypothetical protein CC78DRAFT_565900 [Lojkania enalia]|uniref:DUF6590 domain-containing protein n=1 Tax=Lojkania enalia TaxID=147567 RepID=A0A9P4N2V4_9PLEO|nr:hypothetical protein CC78DRAFT_565900 [Didymosphaeria enalia]